MIHPYMKEVVDEVLSYYNFNVPEEKGLVELMNEAHERIFFRRMKNFAFN